MRSHTNTRPFACSHSPCTKTFLRQAHLTRHVQSTHNDVRTHVCPTAGCGKAFATATRLRRHESTHTARGKHRCTEAGCGRAFRKAATLAMHTVTEHEGRPAYTCDAVVGEGVPCGQGFNDAHKLKLHRERNHTADRFRCTMCTIPTDAGTEPELRDLCFATYDAFVAHRKAAHPPVCGACGHVARGPAELAQHYGERHGPEPPPKPARPEVYRCEAEGCGRAFGRPSTLINHVKNLHSTSRPFVCRAADPATLRQAGGWDGRDACDQSFASKAKLERHVRRTHVADASPEAPRRRRRRTSRASAQQPANGGAEPGEKSIADEEAQAALDEMDDWGRVLERGAASGGPFWLGGEEDEATGTESSEWEVEEMEMERLVERSAEDEIPLDPALTGDGPLRQK